MLGRQVAAGGETVARRDADADARLIAQVVGRDLRAFEALYRRFHPRLSRFLVNILRRPHLVEEVLNDTMLVVWTHPDRYNGRSKVSTWVFAIAWRKALKALRRHQDPIEDAKADARPSPEPGPEQQMDGQQVRAALRTAMAGLSPEHRTVVDLTYFHEMGYREIAEIMECPVDTVKTRMFHARRRLRERLPGRFSDWI
ncbi:MAG TPA: sigma-70 family RNA polymerase sigma factor [Caulobacteraceae bacterium]|nr:sigma-70 family RNA polymerase sigma factor [Caulobacteraceae bacterium]